LREILEGGGHEVIATFDADIEEGQDVMKEFKGAPALDAGLLAAAQAFEHYEIARYGTLKSRAAELGLNQAMKLLGNNARRAIEEVSTRRQSQLLEP
jgi:ferritin-like metal-binding protein YciE